VLLRARREKTGETDGGGSQLTAPALVYWRILAKVAT
jgi:hypothetical protein